MSSLLTCLAWQAAHRIYLPVELRLAHISVFTLNAVHLHHLYTLSILSTKALEHCGCRELADDPLQPISYTGEGPGGSTYCVNMSQIMRQIRLLVSCLA